MTSVSIKISIAVSPIYTMTKSPIIFIVLCLSLVACGFSEVTPTPEYSFTAKVLGAETHIQPGENRNVGVEVTNTGNVETVFQVSGGLKPPKKEEESLPVQTLKLEAKEVGNAIWEHNFIDSGKWELKIDISSPTATSLKGDKTKTSILIVEICDGLDVYRVWLSGYPTLDCKLWGLPMLWWGRIGKLVALLSAFAIIVEFAGPTRMRAWGQSLHRAVDVRALVGRLVPVYLWLFWTQVNWWAKILLFWLPRARPLRERFRDDSLRHLRGAGALGRWFRYSIIAMFVIFIGLIAILTLLSINDPLFLLLLVILVFLMFLLGWSVVLFMPLAFVIAFSAVNVLILEPFAWMMEKGETRIKISSFGLFLVAAHFDLLAS